MQYSIRLLLEELYNNFEMCIFRDFLKLHASKVVLPTMVRLCERLHVVLKLKYLRKECLLNRKNILKLDVTIHALVLINVLSSSHGHVTQSLIKNIIFGERRNFIYLFFD